MRKLQAQEFVSKAYIYPELLNGKFADYSKRRLTIIQNKIDKDI